MSASHALVTASTFSESVSKLSQVVAAVVVFFAALLVNVVQMAIAFSILTLQGMLPLNPMGFGGLHWDLALNTVVSFATTPTSSTTTARRPSPT